MATVIGITTVPFEGEQLKKYVDIIGDAVTEGLGLPPTMKSVTIHQLPPEASTPKPYGLITFFVYSAPNKPLDAKREMIRRVQEATDWFFGGPGKVRTVIIIKEHTDENVGVAGVLRADAKR